MQMTYSRIFPNIRHVLSEIRSTNRWLAIVGVFLISTMLTGLAGCSTNPATGRQELILMDAEDEATIGMTAHPRIVEAYGGAYVERGINAYVTSLVARIVENSAQPDLDYTVTVLDSSLVNALALPGGYVYVTRGLLALAGDEAELAGVIAHEIAHVNARHVAQRQTAAVGTSILGALVGSVLGSTAVNGVVSRGTSGLLASYSREQESEADLHAVSYLARSHYDPYAVRDFLQSINSYAAMQAELVGEEYDPTQVGWLSSHPATEERIVDAAEAAQQSFGPTSTRNRRKEQFYTAIDGLLFGENRERGFIRGSEFIHTVERFRFSAPPQFRLASTPQSVWAIGPDKTIVKFDSASKAPGQSIDHYLVDEWAAAFALEDIASFKIAGLAAASARTRLQGLATRIVAIEAGPRQVYRFLAGVPEQVKEQYEAPLAEMFQSFRLMSVAEAADFHLLRVHVVAVTEGMTLENLAAQMAFADAQVARFRLLNGLADTDELIVGDWVKLIVEGL